MLLRVIVCMQTSLKYPEDVVYYVLSADLQETKLPTKRLYQRCTIEEFAAKSQKKRNMQASFEQSLLFIYLENCQTSFSSILIKLSFGYEFFCLVLNPFAICSDEASSFSIVMHKMENNHLFGMFSAVEWGATKHSG